MTLEARIAEALSGAAKSSALAALIEEANAADLKARQTYDEAEGRSLDPRTPPAEAAEARRRMDEVRFVRDRPAAGIDALNELLDRTLADEHAARQAQALTDAAKRQKAAAAVLADRYPRLAAEIVAIIEECRAADREVSRAGGNTKSHVIAGWPGLAEPGAFLKLPRAGSRGLMWPKR